MAVTISVVHLTVDDVDSALAFWGDALGFDVVKDVSPGEHRFVTLQPPAQAELRIVLSQPHAGRSPTGGDALARLLASGELGPVHLGTDDLEATVGRLAAVPGAEVVQEPDDRFWGVRDAAVRDPAGNLLRVEQR